MSQSRYSPVKSISIHKHQCEAEQKQYGLYANGRIVAAAKLSTIKKPGIDIAHFSPINTKGEWACADQK
jgi:hypothetical protein